MSKPKHKNYDLVSFLENNVRQTGNITSLASEKEEKMNFYAERESEDSSQIVHFSYKSSSKVWWNIFHCSERNSELTCHFLSCLLIHRWGKKQELSIPTPNSKSASCHQLFLVSQKRGKTKILKKAIKSS